MKTHQQDRCESGMALLMVTLLLFVMAIVVLELISSSHVQVLISENLTDEQKGFYIEEEAVIQAEEVLYLDINPGEMLDPSVAGMTLEEANRIKRQKRSDSYHDYWAKESYIERFGKSWLKADIQDEERKFNINYLVSPTSSSASPLHKKFLEKLLKNMEYRDTDISEIVSNITDYLDKNTKGKYEDGAKNGPMSQIGELLALEEVDKELFYGNDFPQGEVSSETEIEDDFEQIDIYDDDDDEKKEDKAPFEKNEKSPPIEEWEELEIKPGLKDILTVYGDGKININTASYPILLALFDDESTAINVIIARKKTPFADIEELKNVSGATAGLEKYRSLLKVSSNYFNSLMTIQHRNMTKYRYAIIRRAKNGVSNILFRGATL